MITPKDIDKRIGEVQKIRGLEDGRPIFKILLIENPDKEHILDDGRPSGFPDTGDQYNIGFYYSLQDAIDIVENNRCDLHEGCYNAAFILMHFQGLYSAASPTDRMYYLWNPDQKKFIQTEEPKIFRHIAF